MLVQGQAYPIEIRDECTTFIPEHRDPEACTTLLRGAIEERLLEEECNLAGCHASVSRILSWSWWWSLRDGCAHALTEKSKAMTGTEQWPYRAVTQASVVIS